jgi:hypothetical protein
MLRKVLSVNATEFGLPLIRAGIAHQISEFTTEEQQAHFTELAKKRNALLGNSHDKPPSYRSKESDLIKIEEQIRLI